MSLVHRCDRCGAIADAFPDEIPDGWQAMSLPARGSQGARSRRDAVICVACDDSLYEWTVNSEAEGGGS